jgi:MFS family permease
MSGNDPPPDGPEKAMSPTSILSNRGLIVICLASLGWAFSFGLGAPLASLWLDAQGYGKQTIGLNTGIYYLGIALAAGLIPWLMRRWGPGCVVAGCILTGITVMLFPYSGSTLGYYGIRLLNGIAGAMSLIPTETYVNRNSPAEHRSRNFGFYALSITIGWALGNLVGLQMYPATPRLAFIVGGLAAVLAGFAIKAWMPRVVTEEEAFAGHAPLEFRRNFLSFGTAWSQGFLEGGMVAFMSLYLIALGLKMDRVSWLTSSIMVGVILFQVPVAWFADRLGRLRILLGCYGVVITGLCLLPWCGDSIWLVVWLFLVGGCSGAFYPLGLALLGERIAQSGLARANAWFLAMNCLGSLMGPGIMGIVMKHSQKQALFLVALASVLLVLLSWLAVRWRDVRRRGAALVSESPPFADERNAA